jgi:KDO2-lipid IV(A) lauroyltransferase
MTITLGQQIGMMSRRLLKKRIHIAHSNLQHAYGEGLSYAERNRIINRLLSLLGEAFVESVIFTSRDANKNIHVEGLEHLEKALKMNKGAILLGPHFGLWELAGHVFGSRLENSSTVYKPLKNPYVDNYLIKTRKKKRAYPYPEQKRIAAGFGKSAKRPCRGDSF